MDSLVNQKLIIVMLARSFVIGSLTLIVPVSDSPICDRCI